MSMLKKSLAAVALLGLVATPMATNADPVTAGAATSVAGGLSAGAIAAIVAGIILTTVVISEANDDGKS